MAVQAIRCGVVKESVDDMETKERYSLIDMSQMCTEQLVAVLMPSNPNKLLIRMIVEEVGDGPVV